MIEIEKYLQPIKNKLFTIIGRGIVSLVKGDGKVQKLQIKGLKNELISDVERLQEYGFESFPDTTNGTPEAAMLSINGNRDQMIVIKVHDRTLRPTDLQSGDVRVYDSHGNTIKLDTNGITITDKNNNIVTMKSGEISIAGSALNIFAASEAFVLGNTAQTELNKDQALMNALQTAINAWVPIPNDGGAALKAALAAFLALPQASYASILSTKIKGE